MIIAGGLLGDASFLDVEPRLDVFDQPWLLAEDLLAGVVKINLVGRVRQHRSSCQKGAGTGQR